MVKCEKCGKQAPDDSILCPHCGHRLKKPETPKLPKIEKELPPIENDEPEPKKEGKDKSEKRPLSIVDTSSPYTKKPKTPTNIIILFIVLIVAVTIVIFLMSSMQGTQDCQPDWFCGDWSQCENSSQRRGCVDLNECGTEEGKPTLTRSCNSTEGAAINVTQKLTNDSRNCSYIGEKCISRGCCSGYCVHGICVENTTHCGDTYCDPGENCVTCEHDCGKCTTERDLEQNVFTEPLNHFNITDFKENGYVIVRYLYNDMCSPCFYPDNFENELRDIAANYKDLVVLLLIDTFDYKEEAEKYAEFSGVVQTPTIVIEGIANGKHDRTSLYSNYLSQNVEKYGISGAVGREVCSHTDYCEWNGTIERNY